MCSLRSGMRARLTMLFLAGTFLCSASVSAGQRGIVPILDREGQEVGWYRESHALLIGVGHYTNGWPDLGSIPRELDLVAGALQEQGFEIVRHLNPDSTELERAFREFIDTYGLEKENRLLFFFAGHGYTLVRGSAGEMGYIVPADAPDPTEDEVEFKRKAVSMNQILTWARRIEAKHALFLFDSCFSGTVFQARNLPDLPPDISELTNEPVRQFITAGKADETVLARSVFTPAFVDAITHKLADRDGDGFVTGTELGLYLRKEVPQHAQQHPQFGTIADYEYSRGDFVFAVGANERHAAGHAQAAPPSQAQPSNPSPPVSRTAPSSAPATPPMHADHAMAWLAQNWGVLFSGIGTALVVALGGWWFGTRRKRQASSAEPDPVNREVPPAAPIHTGGGAFIGGNVSVQGEFTGRDKIIATSGANVALVQELLTTLGYDAGGADGKAGPKTRAAVQAFQADQGLPVDGEITKPLLGRLRARARGSARR